MFLLFIFLVLFIFVFHIKKIEKLEKYKNSMCYVYIGTCVPWMAIETKFSKICISCSLDKASQCTTKQVSFVARVCDEYD